MKKIAVLFSLTAGLFAAEIPRPAPDIVIHLPNGKTPNISDYRGKVLVVAFILTT